MAEKAKKDNKNLIIGICAAVAIVVVVVVAIVLVTKGGSSKLDDSYFVSDGTKYVLTVDVENTDEEYTPVKSHMVYYYSGDDITGVKVYYEYANADDAKAAYDALKEVGGFESFKSVELDGKYLIMTSKESEYAELKASDIKQQIEFMEMLQNMNLEETTDEEE